MNRIIIVVIMILTSTFYTSLAGAQFVMPEARFVEAPKLGDLIPDLVLVDDQGNPASLRELTKGHYTVLTLGCLT